MAGQPGGLTDLDADHVDISKDSRGPVGLLQSRLRDSRLETLALRT